MLIVPRPRQANEFRVEPAVEQDEALNWVGFAAGSALIAGGLLLLTGQRRAGMVAASAGTALALLDQQETLRSWWNVLPTYLDEFQATLNSVQHTVSDVAAKRDKLHRLMVR
jgi:hypothetical protein